MHSDTPRIMSLTDASQKMSKSNGPSRSRIHVDDTDEEIRSKYDHVDVVMQSHSWPHLSYRISKAKTDAIKEIRFDPQNRPEMSNLLQMFAALEGCSVRTSFFVRDPLSSFLLVACVRVLLLLLPYSIVCFQ